jgi:hypothetical protein
VGDHDHEGLSDAQLDDEALLARVAEVFNRMDPVPDIAIELALASFGWRDLDAELVTLVADSHLDETLTAVRAETAGFSPRLLSFEADGVGSNSRSPQRPGGHRRTPAPARSARATRARPHRGPAGLRLGVGRGGRRGRFCRHRSESAVPADLPPTRRGTGQHPLAHPD